MRKRHFTPRKLSAFRVVLISLLMMGFTSVRAAVWTIGASGNFTDFNAAMKSSSVMAGDVLKVLPDASVTGDQTIYKSVSIIGNSWELDSVGTLKEGTAKVQCYLYINADKVSVSNLAFDCGINSSGLTTGTGIIVYACDVTITKCYVNGAIGGNEKYNSDGTVVRQSFFKGLNVNGASGWTVQNNIITSRQNISWLAIRLDDSVIDHNIIFSFMAIPTYMNQHVLDKLTDCTISNNIILHFPANNNYISQFSGIFSDGSFTQNVIRNNVFTGDCPDHDNRCAISSIYDIFNTNANNPYKQSLCDANFTLKPNSLASGYATDGSDCGPWTGPYPYTVGTLLDEPTPSAGLQGDATLHYKQKDNPATQTYQTLLSLFTAIATQGLAGDLNVKVQHAFTYTFTIDDTTLPILLAISQQLASSGKNISMYASGSSTTFNFLMDNTFMLIHLTEIQSIMTQLTGLLQQIHLTDIKVLLNGNEILNDTFQVEANDLLALKTIYQQLGGDNWTRYKWNFESNGRRKEDFPGVSFTSEGKVDSIYLWDNNLEGKLFAIHAPQLSELKSLDMGRNKIAGDVSPFVKEMSQLHYLNMSYNRISEISDSFPASCYSKNLQYQNREYSDDWVKPFSENIYYIQPVVIPISRESIPMTLPSLFTYEYTKVKNLRYPYQPGNEGYGYLYERYDTRTNEISFNNSYRIYTARQDAFAVMEAEGGSQVTDHSAYPVVLRYKEGDANMDYALDVLDVQYTLKYILAPSTVYYFNFSAANTYDKQLDSLINVQDIVATVNMMLDTVFAPEPELLLSRRQDAVSAAPTYGTLSTESDCVMLEADKPVAAIDILLAGVTTSQVALQLNHRDFQMIGRDTDAGARFVIFSPTGKSIAPGIATRLLRTSAYATPVYVKCADTDAEDVAISISDAATSILSTLNSTLSTPDAPIFDLGGRKLSNGKLSNSQIEKGIYVKNGRKVIVK